MLFVVLKILCWFSVLFVRFAFSKVLLVDRNRLRSLPSSITSLVWASAFFFFLSFESAFFVLLPFYKIHLDSFALIVQSLLDARPISKTTALKTNNWRVFVTWDSKLVRPRTFVCLSALTTIDWLALACSESLLDREHCCAQVCVWNRLWPSHARRGGGSRRVWHSLSRHTALGTALEIGTTTGLELIWACLFELVYLSLSLFFELVYLSLFIWACLFELVFWTCFLNLLWSLRAESAGAQSPACWRVGERCGGRRGERRRGGGRNRCGG